MSSRWLMASAVAVLAGCAQVPASARPSRRCARRQPSGGEPHGRGGDRPASQARRDARRSGDLATAAAQWQILTLLAPDDAAYARELAAVRASIDKEARDIVAAGMRAMAAGDLDRASAADAARAGARSVAARRGEDAARNRPAPLDAHPGRPGGQGRPAGQGRRRRRAPRGRRARRTTASTSSRRSRCCAPAIRAAACAICKRVRRREPRQPRGAPAHRQRRRRSRARARGPGRARAGAALYEQAIALRGDASAPWAARVPPLKKALSQDYLDKGTRAYRTNIAQAITFFETSVKYDPANTQAALKLKDAKAARDKLDKIKVADRAIERYGRLGPSASTRCRPADDSHAASLRAELLVQSSCADRSRARARAWPSGCWARAPARDPTC